MSNLSPAGGELCGFGHEDRAETKEQTMGLLELLGVCVCMRACCDVPL
jgi:hypothetical protein